MPSSYPETDTSTGTLAETLRDQVDRLLREAEQNRQPLEVDPWRARLFELFVTAEAGGFLDPEGEDDLTADGLCRDLAARWGLREATQEAFQSQSRIPADQLQKMRTLWSLMRMWMEWTYAWQRWAEFHPNPTRR